MFSGVISHFQANQPACLQCVCVCTGVCWPLQKDINAETTCKLHATSPHVEATVLCTTPPCCIYWHREVLKICRNVEKVTSLPQRHHYFQLLNRHLTGGGRMTEYTAPVIGWAAKAHFSGLKQKLKQPLNFGMQVFNWWKRNTER